MSRWFGVGVDVLVCFRKRLAGIGGWLVVSSWVSERLIKTVSNEISSTATPAENSGMPDIEAGKFLLLLLRLYVMK